MSDECRGAFEKEFNLFNMQKDKTNEENYYWMTTQSAWVVYESAWQARQKEIDQLAAALRIEHEKVIDLECMHHWTESLEKHYERINEKVGNDCSVCNLLAKYREARDA